MRNCLDFLLKLYYINSTMSKPSIQLPLHNSNEPRIMDPQFNSIKVSSISYTNVSPFASLPPKVQLRFVDESSF